MICCLGEPYLGSSDTLYNPWLLLTYGLTELLVRLFSSSMFFCLGFLFGTASKDRHGCPSGPVQYMEFRALCDC
jgi:hypothetical protein